MLSITRKNVNDRISNRADNGVSGLVIELLQCLHGMCCYLHQVCFVERVELRASGSGLKRNASKPAPTQAAFAHLWRTWPSTTARTLRSTGFAPLAG